MPQVVFTANAIANLVVVVNFLKEKNPDAALRAIARIRQSLSLLAQQPQIGIPVPEHLYHRNLPISFGASGYVARYRYAPNDGVVVVLAIRHAREAGFTGMES